MSVHRAFVIYLFIQNNEAMIATQTAVRIHFVFGFSAAGIYKYQERLINWRLPYAKKLQRLIHRMIRNFIGL